MRVEAGELRSWSAVLWSLKAKERHSGCPQVPRTSFFCLRAGFQLSGA